MSQLIFSLWQPATFIRSHFPVVAPPLTFSSCTKQFTDLVKRCIFTPVIFTGGVTGAYHGRVFEDSEGGGSGDE